MIDWCVMTRNDPRLFHTQKISSCIYFHDFLFCQKDMMNGYQVIVIKWVQYIKMCFQIDTLGYFIQINELMNIF